MTTGRDPVTERRVLSANERLEEALFTGLRLTEGLDIEAVGARYGVDVWERYGEALRPFLDEGWLVREGGAAAVDPRRDADGQRSDGRFRVIECAVLYGS